LTSARRRTTDALALSATSSLSFDQRTARLGVLDADTVVEQINDLVGQPGRGLCAERQQRRMAKHRVATADRLAGRVPHVLREHPPPVRRDHLQWRRLDRGDGRN
jgi:hypothetical protein